MQIDEDALEVLSEVGSKTTLRYAVQLLTPSAITACIAEANSLVGAGIFGSLEADSQMEQSREAARIRARMAKVG